MTTADTTLPACQAGRSARPEPPEHVLVRDGVGIIWQRSAPGEWTAITGEHRYVARWSKLDSGKFGDLDLLIAVPYRPSGPADPEYRVSQMVAEALLNPVAMLMQQLAEATGAGITAVIADTYRRGAEARKDT